MKGDGNYFVENVVPITFVRWCAGCSAEQAVDVIDVEFNGHWVPIDIGQDCLTRLAEEGKV